jgi:hypothetical protein
MPPLEEIPFVWQRTEHRRFLVIRLEVLQLFDFDEQVAKVASVLFRLHDNAVERNKAVQSSDDPWFTISKRQIRGWCLGLAGLKSIDRAIEVINGKGFLTIADGKGIYATNSYLIDVVKLNALLKALPPDTSIPDPEDTPNRRKGWEAKERLRINAEAPDVSEVDAEFSKDAEVLAQECGSQLRINADNTERTSQEEKHQVISPIIPTPEPDTETDILTVDTIASFLENDYYRRTTKRQKLGNKLKPKVEAAFEAIGHNAFLAKWERTMADGQATLDRAAAALAGSTPFIRNHGRADTGKGTAAFFDRPRVSLQPRNTPARDTRAYVSTINAPIVVPPSEARAWNERVPGMTWEKWTPELAGLMDECLADPEFVRQWPAVLEKCAAFDAAGEGKSLKWVLSREGWARIANKEFDWLIKPKNGNGSNPNKAKIDAMLKGMLNA